MESSFQKLIQGYQTFGEKYATGDESVMRRLAVHGQQPQVMVVACSDSRVDPALLLQCEPGELFMVRNVANIIPPCAADDAMHGVSAALEFGICHLQVKHLIILGHSACGGISALLKQTETRPGSFINRWMSVIDSHEGDDPDDVAKQALHQSHSNSLTFPWLKERVDAKQLAIHRWFFNIHDGEIQAYDANKHTFEPLA